jgi:plasmid stabilization system protein ParE
MIKVEFHPEADLELEKAKNWYQERSELAARAFATDIAHAVRTISQSPHVWPETRPGERRYILPRFPYSILYRVRSDYLFITAVAHQKRRPGYWRLRR